MLFPLDPWLKEKQFNAVRKRKGGSGEAMLKYYRDYDKAPKGNSHNMQNLMHGEFSFNFQLMFNQTYRLANGELQWNN